MTSVTPVFHGDKMLYIKFIFFCIKVLFQLKDFKSFMDCSGDKAKNYRIELKNIDQKIKMAKAKGQSAKKEHVFLSMFYECVNTADAKEKQEELMTLFCLLYLWHCSLDNEIGQEEVQE